MNRKLFTEEQQQLLRQNPYIYSVTETRITLTKEPHTKPVNLRERSLKIMVLTSTSLESDAYGAFPIISVQNIKSTGNSMKVMVHGVKQPDMWHPQMLPGRYPRLMKSNSSGMK